MLALAPNSEFPPSPSWVGEGPTASLVVQAPLRQVLPPFLLGTVDLGVWCCHQAPEEMSMRPRANTTARQRRTEPVGRDSLHPTQCGERSHCALWWPSDTGSRDVMQGHFLLVQDAVGPWVSSLPPTPQLPRSVSQASWEREPKGGWLPRTGTPWHLRGVERRASESQPSEVLYNQGRGVLSTRRSFPGDQPAHRKLPARSGSFHGLL